MILPNTWVWPFRMASLSYRPEIDGLRAIAVGSVILYHADLVVFGRTIAAGGYLGVDIFFVISGFLISTILIRDIEAGRFTFASFYERRARRILPPLLIMMAATVPIVWNFMIPKAAVEYAGSGLSALGFVSNVWFFFEDSYVAEPSLTKPLLHTWSLAVEEQFYLVFPVFLLVALKLRLRWQVFALAFLTLLSLASAHDLSRKSQDFAFFLLPTRFWELGVGSLVAYALHHGFSFPFRPSMRNCLAGFATVSIVASICLFTEDTRHPSVLTVIPVVATALVIWVLHPEDRASRFLGHPALSKPGLISYSLYLWHWPVFVLMRGIGWEDWLWVGIVVSIVLAVVSYAIVEQPARHRWSLKRLAGLYGALTALLAGFFVYLLVSDGAPQRMSIDTQLANRDGYTIGGQRCHHFDRCVVNWEISNERIVLVGDSHAGAISGAIGRYAEEHGIGYAQWTSSACLQIPDVIVLDRDQSFNEDCSKRGQALQTFLNEAKPSTIIHMGYYPFWLNGSGIRSFGRKPVVPAIGTTVPLFSPEDRIIQGWSDWVRAGHKLVLIAPAPELFFDPFSGIQSNGFMTERSQKPTPLDLHLKSNESFRGLVDLSSDRLDLVVFDPAVIFCDNDFCFHEREEEILYSDDDHLSAKGAQKVLEGLIAEGLIP